MEKVLMVSGFGDVHEEHFERGLVLAENYFFEHSLDFLKCYEAFAKDEKSELGKHWGKAEQVANLALYGFNLQDSSMLELKVEEEINVDKYF